MKVKNGKIVLLLDIGDGEFTETDCSVFVSELSENLYADWGITVDDALYAGKSFNGEGEVTDNQIGDIYIDY